METEVKLEELAAPQEPEESSEDEAEESESDSESDEEDYSNMTDAERKRAKAVFRIQVNFISRVPDSYQLVYTGFFTHSFCRFYQANKQIAVIREFCTPSRVFHSRLLVEFNFQLCGPFLCSLIRGAG